MSLEAYRNNEIQTPEQEHAGKFVQSAESLCNTTNQQLTHAQNVDEAKKVFTSFVDSLKTLATSLPLEKVIDKQESIDKVLQSALTMFKQKQEELKEQTETINATDLDTVVQNKSQVQNEKAAILKDIDDDLYRLSDATLQLENAYYPARDHHRDRSTEQFINDFAEAHKETSEKIMQELPHIFQDNYYVDRWARIIGVNEASANDAELEKQLDQEFKSKDEFA